MTFAASHFNDSATVILFKLTLPNCDGFNPAVGMGGNAPEKIYILPAMLTVEP